MEEQTALEQTTPEQNEPRHLVVRFFTNKSQNPKAPVAHYRLELDGSLAGLVIRGQVWATEGRGSIDYRIDIPGRSRFGDAAIAPAVALTQDSAGAEHEVPSIQDPRGHAIAEAWPSKLKEAYYRYLRTGVGLQAVSF